MERLGRLTSSAQAQMEAWAGLMQPDVRKWHSKIIALGGLL